ncbi:class I SAM-dependent methyltransferase [Fretibacterium fastidiosum]|uniref:Methyltransferase domain n=1 Tax=Fretibacterium fastidiosum TaxID=651822 RepID=A0AB94IY15_9BACT|nr:class I SAM-dependent methyltransferase [Fretibacterium fastidiosum]CBL28641.1 Methyltransferase domain [Fretibacterium fastidiosum]
MQHRAFEKMLETQDTHWWFKGKRRILNKIIEKRVFTGEPCDILEIGCGTGSNLPMLARFGNVVGLELDDYARKVIPPLPGVSIAKGWLPDGLEAVRGRQFDLVCLFDVLEHIEHDGEALSVLKKLIRPDGKLLLTVPAYQWMFGPHDRDLGHYRRYTRPKLRALCVQQGYTVSYTGYINSLLFPFMAVSRIAGRLMGGARTVQLETSVPPFKLNELLYTIFSAESFWIPNISLPFGGSVVLLCEGRKP